MKRVTRLFVYHVTAIATVAILLLSLNFAFFYNFFNKNNVANGAQTFDAAVISEQLLPDAAGYALEPQGVALFQKEYAWGMLLDETGKVIWSQDLPEDIPLNYTISEVADFTQGYLNGFPVYVSQHPDGLLVLGTPKHSFAKFQLEYTHDFIDRFPKVFCAIVLVNILISLSLSSLVGYWVMRTIKPLARSAQTSGQKRIINLSSHGPLRELIEKIHTASDELQRQNKALEKRDIARTAWITAISHDIKTPISIVLGYSCALEENEALPKEVRVKAKIIQQQGQEIKEIINDLNQVITLEYDDQPLHYTKIHPAELIRQVYREILSDGHDDDNYKIKVETGRGTVNGILNADEKFLKRAIRALVDNSVRHNPQGCAIRISVRFEQNDCVFTVADNGVGVPSKLLAQLQANAEVLSANTPDEQYPGLGLRTVRQIAHAHHGTLFLTSRNPKGFVAIITIPRNK